MHEKRLFVRELFARCSVAACLLAFFAQVTSAMELWSDAEGRHTLSLSGALKATGLISHLPEDPLLYAEDWTATELMRVRLGLSFRAGRLLNAEVAYEHRARYVSDGAGGAGGAFLPATGEAPFRIAQLDREVSRSGDRFSHRHELDRAQLALHPSWGEVTVGRQAIGLGRGVLFSAVDLFNPFSPLEVDREWRRGVDAFRAEYRLSGTSSAEVIAVLGDRWDESALLTRIRGYLGNVDAEVLAGRRVEDDLVGISVSAAVLDAEVHGEVALFDAADEQPDGGLFGSNHLVTKAVLGSSYTFGVGNGLTVLAELHYSGFGVEDIEDAVPRLLDSAFRERYLRGDMQILGRYAAGMQASYPVNATLSVALLILQSPVDGSGVASPSLRWDLNDSVSLLCNLFVPWGEEPRNGLLQSEYGGTPESVFVQLNAYF